MLFNNKKWYLPLVVLGLVLVHVGCSSADKKKDTGPAPQQSPINIVTADVVDSPDGPAAPEFGYSETAFTVANTGHDIQATAAEGAEANNALTVDGVSFALKNFHFHAPSEHTLDGTPGAMELHLVHQDADGNYAVVAFLINAGDENTTLGGVFSNLPAADAAPATVDGINLSDLLNGDESFYRYNGSLTTDPFTEGVKWVVVATALSASEDQINGFTALYPSNARGVQDIAGRQVFKAQAPAPAATE